MVNLYHRYRRSVNPTRQQVNGLLMNGGFHGVFVHLCQNSAIQQLLALCREQQVAVQTIKSLARGGWGDQPQQGNTWYHPLTEQADIDRAVHWVLSRPELFLNTSGDMELLPKVLDAAGRFEAGPADEEMAAMVSRLAMAPLFV